MTRIQHLNSGKATTKFCGVNMSKFQLEKNRMGQQEHSRRPVAFMSGSMRFPGTNAQQYATMQTQKHRALYHLNIRTSQAHNELLFQTPDLTCSAKGSMETVAADISKAIFFQFFSPSKKARQIGSPGSCEECSGSALPNAKKVRRVWNANGAMEG